MKLDYLEETVENAVKVPNVQNVQMSKKEFKSRCSFHVYGQKRTKLNAIYFDWKCEPSENAVGYKYMVKATTANCSKKELFDMFYDWVMKEVSLPYYVDYRYAMSEDQRFKVKITESFRS